MRDLARSPASAIPVPAWLLALALAATLSPLAAPETLVFSKAKTDTFYVHIDYDRDPDVAPDKPWKNWDETKVDSFYVTDSGTADQARHVHYAHPFYAEVNGTKGYGSDYIYYVDDPSGNDPHYTAEIVFEFRFGDTVSGWQSSNGWHINPYPRLNDFYAKGLANGDEMNFFDYRSVGDQDISDHVFLDFVARRPGWIGNGNATALARSPRPRDEGTRNGALVMPSAQTVLTVPASATRLRLIDATGRTAWEADGLLPGARISAPAELKPGIFRCLWSS
jgi:hypothetical protein